MCVYMCVYMCVCVCVCVCVSVCLSVCVVCVYERLYASSVDAVVDFFLLADFN